MAEVFRGTVAELKQAIRALPRILAGLAPDSGGVARSLQLTMGVALLSQIQQSYIVKSRGGVGSDGIKWKPLSRAAIAARPITAGEKKAAGIKGKRVRGLLTPAEDKRVRGLLTPAEDKRWRKIFGTRKAWLMGHGMGEQAAAARSASIAWTVLKSEGAKTRLGTFGGRSVEILRSSGTLFRSLTPGVEDRPYTGADADKQVFEVPRGSVIVGTKVPYASRQHATRPLWPAAIPPPWWTAIKLAFGRGLVKVFGAFLAGRNP